MDYTLYYGLLTVIYVLFPCFHPFPLVAATPIPTLVASLSSTGSPLPCSGFTDNRTGVSNNYIHYSRESLLSMRYLRPRPKLSSSVLMVLKSHGILKYRGCRGGINKLRSMPKELSKNRSYVEQPVSSTAQLCNRQSIQPAQHIRTSVYPKISAQVNNKTANPPTTTINSSVIPSLYLLNPTSLAKENALKTLHAELIGHSIDIAIISETWFKLHHSDNFTQIDNYM